MTLGDVVVAAPIAFALGLALGFWIGARFDLRRKNGP